jgi:hypothetical protein
MDDEQPSSPIPAPVRCRQCDRVLAEADDREVTSGGVFCAPCFAALKRHLEAIVAGQGADINYVNAALGGLAGGALGAVVWWGFTVVTHVSFGLVAVVIGFLAGKGIVMATGGKRSLNLQVMSMVIAAIAYAFASYLVNRSFILQAIAADPSLQTAGATLPIFAPPALMFAVIRSGFQVFDLVFLAIVIYQAWKMPAPFKLAG